VALQDDPQENPPALKKGRWSEDEKEYDIFITSKFLLFFF